MKNNTNNKTKLGLFVTVGVLLFIIGIYFIGAKQQLFNSTFRISGILNDVSGLQVGNNVRFSGINVGVIEDIEIITDTSVRVDMIIDEKIRKFIKKDALAIIGSEGFMGNKVMSITPGSNGQKIIENNDYVETVIPISLDDILLNLKVTTDNTAVIASDMAVIVNNIRSGRGTIGKLFMDSTFAENMDATLVNLKQGAGGFKQNMDAAKNSFLLRGFLKKKKEKTISKK